MGSKDSHDSRHARQVSSSLQTANSATHSCSTFSFRLIFLADETTVKADMIVRTHFNFIFQRNDSPSFVLFQNYNFLENF
mmetsp:Transcript_2393/g.3224  ORF Transcript_2393/g.3224 Transcript_2393/m.3224 type:complete len:80 (+) Transcript_2393:676-915(+)